MACTTATTKKPDFSFTVSKTSLSFETYGLVQIKTTLKTIKVYIKEEFSWKTFFWKLEV